MAKRKSKRPTAATVRAGHTVYVATVDFVRRDPVARVYRYQVIGPGLAPDPHEHLPELLPRNVLCDRLLWCERHAIPPRLFWKRRQAERCADRVLADFLRGSRP